jgi:two-component system response regulator MprA
VGADDYVTKPFAVAELIARIRVAARRPASVRNGTSGELEVDPVTHAVRRGELSAALTPTEFRMLAALAARPGEVVRRDQLRAAAWPDGAIVHDNTIDAYILRLRRKLSAVESDEGLDTVRGVGYVLR